VCRDGRNRPQVGVAQRQKRGDGPGPAPRIRPPAGTMDAGGTPFTCQVLPSGSVTKRVPALDFNRNNSTSVRDLRANFCRARDRFATDVENDVGDLEAVIGGYAARVDRRNDHAAVRLVAGRQGGPSFGTSASGTSGSRPASRSEACRASASPSSPDPHGSGQPSPRCPAPSCRPCAIIRARRAPTRRRTWR
jgi:hypothetical protein